jgi:ABC-2 type transport system permease protein
MNGAWVIAEREFKSLLKGPTFFLIAGVSTCIWSFYFLRNLFDFANRSLAAAVQMGGQGGGQPIHYGVFIQHISLVNLVLLFVIPCLTMRMLSEEKKMRTYDLLLTAPITATDISFGKFLAGFALAGLLVLISAIYPLATGLYTSIEYSPLFLSYLGLLLMTATYVAIGLFASSMTESPLLAVVLGVIFNLVLWFLGAGADMTDSPTITAVMEHLAIGKHLFEFLKGSLRMSSFIFFASCIFVFCFLTQRVVESSRWR